MRRMEGREANGDDCRLLSISGGNECSLDVVQDCKGRGCRDRIANVDVRWTSSFKLCEARISVDDRFHDTSSVGPSSSWEWLALEGQTSFPTGTPFAGISVSNFLTTGKVQRGREKNVTRGGWALLQQVTGYVMGARSRAKVMVKQMTLLERASIGAIAGGIAGGVTNVTLHPIDTVKTKLQTEGAAQLYSGPFDVVSKVLASQGIAGLYCGVQAAFVGSVMSSSVYFGTYELAKGILSSLCNWPETLVPPFAAALGNITSSAILVPKEVVKQRMQAGAVGSASDVFMRTIHNEGVRGLYSGYSAALLRNLPSNIISFSTFEYLKIAWLSRSGNTTLEGWQSVISGALAGALSAAVTTPLDLVKTRLMTQARAQISMTGLTGTRAEAAARAQVIAGYTYKGVASTLRHIWTEEGAMGLMKGAGPRIFYSACFSALGFFAFESTRAYLLIKHLEQRDAQKDAQTTRSKHVL